VVKGREENGLREMRPMSRIEDRTRRRTGNAWPLLLVDRIGIAAVIRRRRARLETRGREESLMRKLTARRMRPRLMIVKIIKYHLIKGE